jgi:hypothetical protein
MQVSSNRLRNRHRESICVFTHSGPIVACNEGQQSANSGRLCFLRGIPKYFPVSATNGLSHLLAYDASIFSQTIFPSNLKAGG